MFTIIANVKIFLIKLLLNLVYSFGWGFVSYYYRPYGIWYYSICASFIPILLMVLAWFKHCKYKTTFEFIVESIFVFPIFIIMQIIGLYLTNICDRDLLYLKDHDISKFSLEYDSREN